MKVKNFPNRVNKRRTTAWGRMKEMYVSESTSYYPLRKREMQTLEERIVSPDVARGIRTKKRREKKRS